MGLKLSNIPSILPCSVSTVIQSTPVRAIALETFEPGNIYFYVSRDNRDNNEYLFGNILARPQRLDHLSLELAIIGWHFALLTWWNIGDSDIRKCDLREQIATPERKPSCTNYKSGGRDSVIT
jgi:hypothetical protein